MCTERVSHGQLHTSNQFCTYSMYVRMHTTNVSVHYTQSAWGTQRKSCVSHTYDIMGKSFKFTLYVPL